MKICSVPTLDQNEERKSLTGEIGQTKANPTFSSDHYYNLRSTELSDSLESCHTTHKNNETRRML